MVIESTGVYEILAEVTRRYVIGETLEPPSVKTEQWLRSTEELFFSQPPPFHIVSLDSRFRPDQRVSSSQPLLAPSRHGPASSPTGRGRRGIWQPTTMEKDVGVANTRFHELWLICCVCGPATKTSPTLSGRKADGPVSNRRHMQVPAADARYAPQNGQLARGVCCGQPAFLVPPDR